MPTIPSSEQFIGLSPNVNTTERRSELINAESFPYTMQDFINTISTGQGSQGPQGPQGPQGVQGVTGSQGPAGTVGATGSQGLPGPTGATGATGSTGIVGPQGVQGLQGFQGVAGAVGPAGLNWQGGWSALGVYVIDDAVGYGGASWFCISNIGPVPTTPNLDPTHWSLLASQGAVGQQGAQGIQGIQGIQGSAGAAGLQGAQGPIGLTGATGATGATGLQGAQGVAGTNGTQGPIGPIGATGATGAQGIQGAQGTAGTVGPAGLTWAGLWSALGVYVLNNAVSFGGASYFCYNPAGVGPSASNPTVDTANWALLASQGATGAAGAAGAAGVAGATGTAGPQGIAGVAGATGPQGSTGATGATGPQGIQGVAGPIGPAGLTWVGIWDSLQAYLENYAVSFGGASYFCYNPLGVGPSAIDPATDTANWALLAAVGATGATGAAGVAGATGAAGPAGVAGPTGPQGVQGIQGIQGVPSATFSAVNLSPLPIFPIFTEWVTDVITIPANTFDSFSEVVLNLVGQISKNTIFERFTYKIYLTDTPQVIDTLFDNANFPIKMVEAKTGDALQLTTKLERSFAIGGNDVLFFENNLTPSSNSDNAVLASTPLYTAAYFNDTPKLASGIHGSSIDWSFDWYIAAVAISEDINETFVERWISLK